MKTITASSTTGAPRPVARRRHGWMAWVRRVLLILLIALLALAASGAIYQLVATAMDRRSSPHPASWWMWAAPSSIFIASAKVARR